jgi:hypothetical protein
MAALKILVRYLINSFTNPTIFGAHFLTDCQVFARWDVPALETSMAISDLNACHQASPLQPSFARGSGRRCPALAGRMRVVREETLLCGEDLGEGGPPFRVAAILNELINHHTSLSADFSRSAHNAGPRIKWSVGHPAACFDSNPEACPPWLSRHASAYQTSHSK